MCNCSTSCFSKQKKQNKEKSKINGSSMTSVGYFFAKNLVFYPTAQSFYFC